MDAGASRFEGSICGIGGGEAVPHAVGDIATEDLVQMFNDMGVRCGVGAEEAIACARDHARLFRVRASSATTRRGSRKQQMLKVKQEPS